jgi:hypothetical protein
MEKVEKLRQSGWRTPKSGIEGAVLTQGKSWDERRRVGIKALIDFGALKP